jgi:hypothetical protein
MTAAFVLNFKNPKCRVSTEKYDDARAPPRPKIVAKCRRMLLQLPQHASTVVSTIAAACTAPPRTPSWRAGRCEGTKALTHDANALLVGSSPYKKNVWPCRTGIIQLQVTMSQKWHYAPHSLQRKLQVRVMRDSCEQQRQASPSHTFVWHVCQSKGHRGEGRGATKSVEIGSRV